jgi:hypothetical protein
VKRRRGFVFEELATYLPQGAYHTRFSSSPFSCLLSLVSCVSISSFPSGILPSCQRLWLSAQGEETMSRRGEEKEKLIGSFSHRSGFLARLRLMMVNQSFMCSGRELTRLACCEVSDGNPPLCMCDMLARFVSILFHSSLCAWLILVLLNLLSHC